MALHGTLHPKYVRSCIACLQRRRLRAYLNAAAGAVEPKDNDRPLPDTDSAGRPINHEDLP